MRYLITAGPTREYLDDVRYLSNASSGRMGCALADAAAAAGADVVFICGPIEVEPPACELLIPVVSADEMHRAVLEHAPRCDAVLMAAAVADYRPAERVPGKIKKTGGEMMLRLAPNPDILAELGRRKRPGQVLVGFALEAENIRTNALRKLREKNLDLIVANGPDTLGSDFAAVELLYADGRIERIDSAPKPAVAARILAAVGNLLPSK